MCVRVSLCARGRDGLLAAFCIIPHLNLPAWTPVGGMVGEMCRWSAWRLAGAPSGLIDAFVATSRSRCSSKWRQTGPRCVQSIQLCHMFNKINIKKTAWMRVRAYRWAEGEGSTWHVSACLLLFEINVRSTEGIIRVCMGGLLPCVM